MARNEADREDLFEEFRSATDKWELQLPNFSEVWVTGVRRDLRLSVYCSQDLCYHFDSQNQLLRAFANGALYRTQGKTLARMIRERSPEATHLLRHDLTEDEVREFRNQMRNVLTEFVMTIEAGTVKVLRSVSQADLSTTICRRIVNVLENNCPFAPPFPTRKS